MTRLLILLGLPIVVAVAWLAFDPPAPHPASASSVQPPVARTNAPGEGTCTGCHTGNALNTAGGSVTIPDLPANFVPGQAYTLTVHVQRHGT